MRALLIALSVASIACGEAPHVVEELTFRVAPADQAHFLQVDRDIWTETLSRQVGFLGKEAWVTSPRTDELKLVIRWRARSDWNAVPSELLAATDARFKDAMGDRPYELLGGRAFRVVAPESEAGVGLPIDAVLTAQNLLLAEVVTVENDPVYHRTKRYLAVPLGLATRTLVADATADELGGATLVFDCGDGYHSQVALAEANAASGWIAFRDLDAPAGERWTAGPPDPQKMGRAYVVWLDAKEPAKVTWPYEIERIRLIKSSAAKP